MAPCQPPQPALTHPVRCTVKRMPPTHQHSYVDFLVGLHLRLQLLLHVLEQRDDLGNGAVLRLINGEPKCRRDGKKGRNKLHYTGMVYETEGPPNLDDMGSASFTIAISACACTKANERPDLRWNEHSNKSPAMDAVHKGITRPNWLERLVKLRWSKIWLCQRSLAGAV